jgi:hypothetical protein
MSVMTQITNVLLILIVTVVFSITASLLTVFIDKVLDIRSIVKSIPRLITYNYFIVDFL